MTSKHHHQIWWNYLDSYSGTKPQSDNDSRITAAAKEGRMDTAQLLYDE